ncbi:hypothetical protein PYW08_013031 [Mythimna loreyi]|nr:hypothetical protein PYW08_013031 [Mythimna loreyi]
MVSDTNQSSAPVTDTDNETTSTITSRPRPRKRQYDDEVSITMAEMKKSLETFKLQQNIILESINGIKNQNSEMIKSMELISAQYDDMKNKLITMETERKTHLAYIQTLETKVENLERSQRQSSIEIRNVPVQKNETKDHLLQLVQKVGLATKNCINETHIRDVFRTNADKKGNRSIIVDFSSVIMKEKILTAVKTHNRSNRDNKLNTTHLQLGCQSQPIYIVECLTDKAKKIFYQARDFSKKNQYDFCWTAHGKVFLRQKIGAASHRIDSEIDIDKLQPQKEK